MINLDFSVELFFGPIELYAQFSFFPSRCTATDKINYSEEDGS